MNLKTKNNYYPTIIYLFSVCQSKSLIPSIAHDISIAFTFYFELYTYNIHVDTLHILTFSYSNESKEKKK